MPTDIVIPALGESITSGVIATWRKKDGERVERDETLLELETDKITLELPSPAAGVLTRRAAEGDTVDVGSVVGVIEDKPGAASPAFATGGAPASNVAPRPVPAPPASAAATATISPPAPPAAPARSAPSEPAAAATGAPAPQRPAPTPEVRATPLARKEAETRGVDLSKITPTGPGGRVSEHDVLAAAGAPASPPAHGSREPGERSPSSAPSPAPQPARAVSRERVSPLRAKIAARLVEAQHTAAMLTTFNECDMSAVMDLRARHKEAFEKKHGVGLGFMSFFVKACAGALEAFPLVNAQLSSDPDGRLEILKHHYCDIAVAVGTPKGLTVPVLRNCEALSFAQVESGVRDLAARARDGKLTLDELQGGTFTITNGGIYGSMMSTPILNPPQSAILGMHNIVRRPVENPLKPGSGEIVVRPMMYLALSYDHRIIDGAEAVSFLVHVKKAIESPERMLLGV